MFVLSRSAPKTHGHRPPRSPRPSRTSPLHVGTRAGGLIRASGKRRQESQEFRPDQRVRGEGPIHASDRRRVSRPPATERNSSAHTLRSYEDDLAVFCRFLEEAPGRRRPTPPAADARRLRRYSAWLNGQGYASSTIARRLASLRSFYRYQRRQGVVDDRSGGRPAQPEAAASGCPSLLRVEEVIRLLDAIPTGEPLGRPRPGDVRDPLRRRPAGQRARRAQPRRPRPRTGAGPRPGQGASRAALPDRADGRDLDRPLAAACGSRNAAASRPSSSTATGPG